MALEGFRGSISSLLDDESNSQSALLIIDKEVDNVKDYLRALWRRRNTFVPISRLPPEILSRIFCLVKESAFGDSTYWTKVSHVCHVWRETSVNSPSLWTKLPLASTRWTEEMLSRSKMASLTVSANFCSPGPLRQSESLSMVLPHALRIKNLDLCHYDPSAMQKFLSGMPKSAPRLEQLRLQFSPTPHSTSLDCVLSMDNVCEADRLRRLELTRCTVSWDSQLFGPQLVHLQISFIPVAARPTLDQFLRAFDRMPALESIELRDALPVTRSSGHSSTHSRIFLNNLRLLTISSSNSEAEMFLNGISFPPTVSIKLSCKAETNNDEKFCGVLSHASSFSSASASHPGTKIRTLEVSTGLYTMSGYRSQFRTFSVVASDNDVYLCQAAPNLDLALLTTERPSDQLVRHFCASMPLTNLVMLRLRNTSILSWNTLAETFGVLPHLRSVSASGQLARNLVLALQEVRPNQLSAKVGAISVYFPNLRSISLHDVTFDYEYEDLTIDMLQDCLMWRYECGAEIRELKLTDCHRLESDNVDLLREIVADVEWDEVETGFTESEEEEEDFFDGYYDDEYYSDDDDLVPFFWY